MENHFDVIIIGAGPAGSTAAILLADAGMRVALIEKQPYPRRKVCGECIAAANLPILLRLGIGAALARHAGVHLRNVALVCGNGIIRAPLPAHADPAHQWGLALGREHLDALLLERARQCGVAVFQPWQVCGIGGAPGRFQCRLRAPDTREEQLLVGSLVVDAHGSWEPPIGAGKPASLWRTASRPSDLFAFKANFSGAALEAGLLPVLSFPGGYGGMVVAGSSITTVAFCLRRDTLRQARRDCPGMSAGGAALGWIMRHSSAVRRLLGDARQCGSWLGSGPLHPGIHIDDPGGAVFKLGNAAGEAHPIIGEGIGMALQSAVLLANTLSAGKAGFTDGHTQARLRTIYAMRWRQNFAARIRVSSVYAHLAMRPRLFGGLLPVLERHPLLLTRFAQWCGKASPAPPVQTPATAARYQ